jgi:hypothetical protein
MKLKSAAVLGVRRRAFSILVAVAMAIGVAGFAAPAPAAATGWTGVVTIYTDAWYSGSSLQLSITCGTSTWCWFNDDELARDLRTFGGPCNWTWNDCISSFRVTNYLSSPASICVTFYNDPGRTGSGQITGQVRPTATYNIGQVLYNDMISSIGVRAC